MNGKTEITSGKTFLPPQSLLEFAANPKPFSSFPLAHAPHFACLRVLDTSPWYFIWYKKRSSCWTWITVMAHLSRVKTGSLWQWGQDHANSDSESFLELFLYRPHLQWDCFQTWLQTACSWRLLLATVQFCNADKTLLSISAQGKDLSEGLLHLPPNTRWLEKGPGGVCITVCDLPGNKCGVFLAH